MVVGRYVQRYLRRPYRGNSLDHTRLAVMTALGRAGLEDDSLLHLRLISISPYNLRCDGA